MSSAAYAHTANLLESLERSGRHSEIPACLIAVKQLEDAQDGLCQGRFHEVISLAEQALTVFERVPEAKNHRAVCHNVLAAANGGLRRPTEQATHARTAISLLPPTTDLVETLAAANWSLARGIMNTGDPNGAIGYLETARDLLSNLYAGSNNRASGLLDTICDDLRYLKDR